MQTHATASKSAARRHRPKTLPVFAAAFVAGAVLAYGVDRMVDVHVVRVEPQVESEPIFVALRSLPQGSPVTVWDVALKDWPKAMLPTTALKADASFEGLVLRHPVREGQPLLSVQLVRDGGVPTHMGVAALPAPPRPADAGTAEAPPVSRGPIAEQFVPATPAESPAMAAAEVAPPPTRPAIDPVPVEDVATVDVPAASPVAEPEPTAPTEPAAHAEAPAIVAIVQPRSTDVDEVAVPAAVVTGSTAPTPAASELAAVTPLPAPTPASSPSAAPAELVAPVPSAAPASTPLASVPEAPLAAPVPALPPTDIERSLVGFGRSPAAPAAEPASVLDRSTEADPPAAFHSAPRLHLVVPERVALAVDASFTQPPPAPREEPAPQVAATARGTATAAAAPEGRAGARKPAAASPSARKQPGPRQPATRPQPSQSRGISAWLPSFRGDSRAR